MRVAAAARAALTATRSHSGSVSVPSMSVEGALAVIETITKSLDTMAGECAALEEEGRGNAKVSAALQKYRCVRFEIVEMQNECHNSRLLFVA